MAAATSPAFPVWVDYQHIHHFGDKLHPEHPARIECTLREIHRVFGSRITLHGNTIRLEEDIITACSRRKPWSLLADGDTYRTAATPFLLKRGREMLDAAVDDLVSSKRGGFVLIRPPGHHAGPGDSPGGFCHQNNIWYTALQCCKAGFKNVAIFDWDVHHGDGTETLCRSSHHPIRFCSMHAYGLDIYPGTGDAYESDKILNIPLPCGTGSRTYLRMFREKVLPFLETADILLISAGYDAHKEDPMGYLRLDEDTYKTMSEDLKGLGRPVLFVLEGGYNPDALARSVVATITPWI